MKYTYFILLFICVQFFAFGQTPPCGDKPKKFQKKISKCKLEKDPQKKIEGLTKILGKYPEQAGIYFEIAEYYKKNRNSCAENK